MEEQTYIRLNSLLTECQRACDDDNDGGQAIEVARVVLEGTYNAVQTLAASEHYYE